MIVFFISFLLMERALQLQDYANDIKLFEPYKRYDKDYANEDEMAKELKELGNLIHDQCGMHHKPDFDPHNFDESFRYIHAFLNVRQPYTLSPRVYELIDHALIHRLLHSSITEVQALKHITNRKIANYKNIILWRGDISLLRVDAIVNAANSQMLGCFRPFHKCIDNVIHTFAGPRLRDDCNIFMQKQGFEEPTGTAKITRAYNLPSSFVIHTVGPIYDPSRSEICKKLLISCYKSCLEVASQVESIRSIAFCCISTGVFMFPKEEAAQIAVQTVDQWLTEHPERFDQIVFNVFTPDDLEIYSNLLIENDKEI